MDKTYADRIVYRKKIMKENPDTVLLVNDQKRITPAVRELYTWVLGTYLPLRYPSMFRLHYATFETGSQFMFENQITREIYPAKAKDNLDAKTLLLTLGKTVDEDFLLLLPEEDSEDPKYVLQALVTICPSGWDPREKIGKRLASIHEPVPSYKDKIQGSMDRFFKSLEVGKYVKRSNWSIVTSSELFVPGSGTNHAKAGDKIEQLQDLDPEDVSYFHLISFVYELIDLIDFLEVRKTNATPAP